jgi:hypothetical protein
MLQASKDTIKKIVNGKYKDIEFKSVALKQKAFALSLIDE